MNILALMAGFLMGLGIGCIILYVVSNKMKNEYEYLIQMFDKYSINSNELHLSEVKMRGNLIDIIDILWRHMHNTDACLRRTYNHIENVLMDDFHDELPDAKKDINKSLDEYNEVTALLHKLLEADIPGIKGEEAKRIDKKIHDLTIKIDNLKQAYYDDYGEEYK